LKQLSSHLIDARADVSHLARVFFFILLVGISIGSSTLASAQVPQPSAQETAHFDAEIVVTPERGDMPRNLVAASVVVLDSSAISALPAIHPSEIASFLPGFNIARPQFYAGRPVVSARGFFGGGEAEYILLLVDGVPVADVESGLIDWSMLPASSVRRIEASRGPGASLYGDSAVGGVIQIFTDRAASLGSVTATAGTFGTFTADSSYNRRAGASGFSLSGTARQTQGGFDHSGGDQIAGAGGLDGVFRGFSWRWNAAGDSRNRDDPGVLPVDQLRRDPRVSAPIFRFDTLDRRSVSSAFLLQHKAHAWQPQLRMSTSWRDEDLTRTILFAPDIGDRRARAISTVATGGGFEVTHAFAGARPPVVRLGADLSRAHLETTYRSVSEAGVVGSLDSEAIGHRVRAGFFASSSWEAASRLRLSGSLRWDAAKDGGFGILPSTESRSLRAWSPRAGAVFALRKSGSVNLFTQISRAFKVPTLDQLFDPRPYPNFRGGTFTISNGRLAPQRAINLESGISGAGRNNLRWSILAYRMAVEDEIDFDTRTFSYANIGRSRHVGLEVEAEGRWWKHARPSLTYALTRVVGDADRQLKNVPRHLFTASASVDLPWKVGAHARYSHSGGASLDDGGGYPIEGPSTLDLRVRRPVGRHAFFVDMLNVAGNVYQEYGFTLADFRGGVVPYAYPGAPRAVRAGVTLSF
jgi:iron complex outermembrane recepter protein